MRDEWIAVARGLKWLSVSIRASVIAIYLFVLCMSVSLAFYFCANQSLISDGRLALIPCVVAALVAFITSRMARVLAMRSPRKVPNARFFAIASLILELVGQTGLVTLITLSTLKIDLHDAYTFFGGFVFFAFWVAGKACFQRVMYALAPAVQRPELVDSYTGIWLPSILGYILLGTGITFNFSMGSQPLPCCVVFLGWPGVVLLRFACARYRAVVDSLRFSALREAVRCER